MKKSEVPPAMKVQLSRLFGSNSRIAKAQSRSDAEWKRDLRLVLAETYRYLQANIDADLVHSLMLDSGFAAAYVALETDDFWPGYTEGITRILLCLMGNYPDHRKRKSGSKSADYYKLDKDRSSVFVRNAEQRLHTLFWSAPGMLSLTKSPFEALHEFRDEVGFTIPVTKFLDWYKLHFPEDYSKVFLGTC